MTGKLFKICAIVLGMTNLVLMSSIPVSGSVSFRTVALTGEHAPGAGRGVYFDSFDYDYAPSLNNVGQVAFYGNLAGSGVDGYNDQAIWSDTTDTLRMVIRTGQAAPKIGPDVYLGSFRSLSLFNSGQVMFRGSLYGDGVNNDNAYGYWVGVRTAFNLIARDGDPAPGTEPGTVLYGLNSHGLAGNENGQYVFSAGLKGSVDDDRNFGLWFGELDSIHLLAREGDPAPGIVPSMNFGRWGFKPSMNNAGDVAFSASLVVDISNSRRGIWMVRDGELSLIARENEPPPGSDLNVTLAHIDQPTLNDAGIVSFSSSLAGPDADVAHGITGAAWMYSDNTLKLIARAGDPAPGNHGRPFTDISAIRTSSNGTSLINAQATGPAVYDPEEGFYVYPSIYGLWASKNGTLNLVALDDDPAPGVAPDAEYDFIYSSKLNDAGQISFRASYSTPDHTAYGGAIWVTDSQGQPQAIVQTGEVIDVNNDPLIDDLRTIATVPRYYGFNDAGQLTLILRFTDGSQGVFVVSTPLIGDLDNDGFVGLSDLAVILGNWNQNATPGDISIGEGDVNGDGFVGIEDLNTVLGNWNAGTAPASYTSQSTIPEPGTLGVLAVGAGLVMGKRTKRFSLPPRDTRRAVNGSVKQEEKSLSRERLARVKTHPPRELA